MALQCMFARAVAGEDGPPRMLIGASCGPQAWGLAKVGSGCAWG